MTSTSETSGLLLLVNDESIEDSNDCQQGQQQKRHWFCQRIELPVTLAQTFSLVAWMASICFVLSEIILVSTQETTSTTTFLIGTTTLHPAIALLLVGILWHVLLLWQNLIVALVSLSQEMIATNYSGMILWTDSHRYTYQVLQLVSGPQNQMSSPSRTSQLVHGADTWIIFITLVLTSLCCTTASAKSTILLQLTSVVAFSIALACTQRVVSLKATRCRLDTLNTPVFLVLSVLSLQYSFSDNLLLYLRQIWQRWAEKPVSKDTRTAQSCSTSLSFSTFLSSFLAGVLLVAMSTAMVIQVYEQHGLLSLVTGCFILFLRGLVHGISASVNHLSVREQQAALDDQTRTVLQNLDQESLSTSFLVVLAYLWIPPSSAWNGSVMWWLFSVMAMALVTAMVGQIVKAWATDFPVAFLTSTPVVRGILPLSAITKHVTSVADVLQFFYQTTYQDDILYIGTVEDRLATENKAMQEDVEASCPVNLRIDSYPRSTTNPDVILEEHEF
jgi:hypothetical protein